MIMPALPGIIAAINPVAGALTLTFLDFTESDAASVTLLSTIQAGDLLVLVQKASKSTTAPPHVVPPGWTSVGSFGFNATTFATRLGAVFKIAVSADASKTITGMNGSSSNAKVALVFRPSTPLTTAAKFGNSFEVTNGNPSDKVIASGGGTPPLVVFGAFGELNNTNPASRAMSVTEDGEVDSSSSDDVFCKYKIYNTAPANITMSMDDEGAKNALGGWWIEVA